MSGKTQQEETKQPEETKKDTTRKPQAKQEVSDQSPSVAAMPAKTQQQQPSVFASGDSTSTADLLNQAGLAKIGVDTFKSSDSTFDPSYAGGGLAKMDEVSFLAALKGNASPTSHDSKSQDAFKSADFLESLFKSRDKTKSNDSDALLSSLMSRFKSGDFKSTGGRSVSAGLLNANTADFTSRDWLPSDIAKHIEGMDYTATAVFGTDEATAPTQKSATTDSCRLHDEWQQDYTAGILPPSEDSKPPANQTLVKPAPAPVASFTRKRKAEDTDDEDWKPSEADNKKPAPKKKKSNTSKRSRSRPNYEPKVKKYYERKEKDVLFGRGGCTNHNPGNISYLEEKEKIQPRYLAATKEEKTGIAQELVDIVHGWGGRFLQREAETGRWYEATAIAARKKASQTLREENTPEQRQAKRERYPGGKRRGL